MSNVVQESGQSGGKKPRRARKERTQRTRVERVFWEVNRPDLVHPALIPGISVDDTHRKFRTDRVVFAIAALLILGVVAWAIIAPTGIVAAGTAALGWVTTNFGWMFTILAIAVFAYMMILGYGKTGEVRLGSDDEKPEFSTISWVAMMFSAGIGIGLLFYGPYEPLTYFLDPPSGFGGPPGSENAALEALAQTYLHWGPIAWSFYALVGGSIAYAAYRRGRAPLISKLFTPLLGPKTDGVFGSVIDTFAIIVTLFGTAISLGIGALQIAQGVEIVTGLGPLGNGFIIGAIAVLSALFILSAVSGVTRGIRILSNTNMILAGLLALFVFLAGPTAYLLNLIPASLIEFVVELGTMLVRNPNQGPETAAFMGAWTTYYWAWWVSWAPFVGLFIAKISRGRTLREFVTVVVIVPSLVTFTWFGLFGGTAMWMEREGMGISGVGSSEGVLFAVLENLPLSIVTTIIVLISITVFFVTSADSASLVMGSMSQQGKPNPSRWATILWGTLLGLVAASLLIAGGHDALTGLQSIMVVSSLPFAFVMIGIMVAWWKELKRDPAMLRRQYATAAIQEGVREGIRAHGDDFVFGTSMSAHNKGAGANIDSDDPSLTEWYIDATSLDPGELGDEGDQAPETDSDASKEQDS